MEHDFSDEFDEKIDKPSAVTDVTPKNENAQDDAIGVSIDDFVAYMPQNLFIFMPARDL